MGLKHDAQTDELFRSVLQLKTVDECYLYFEDLLTNKEVRDLGQRLEIAKQIDAGKSYLEAAEALGVSSATIGRVKRCMDYGDGGYRMVLDRLKAADAASKTAAEDLPAWAEPESSDEIDWSAREGSF